jgi:hypothetical protein
MGNSHTRSRLSAILAATVIRLRQEAIAMAVTRGIIRIDN